jgi:hypothetical protein
VHVGGALRQMQLASMAAATVDCVDGGFDVDWDVDVGRVPGRHTASVDCSRIKVKQSP